MTRKKASAHELRQRDRVTIMPLAVGYCFSERFWIFHRNVGEFIASAVHASAKLPAMRQLALLCCQQVSTLTHSASLWSYFIRTVTGMMIIASSSALHVTAQDIAARSRAVRCGQIVITQHVVITVQCC